MGIESIDLGGLLSGVIAYIGGSITTFLFLPQIRKSKNLENESKQSDEWKKLYDESSKDSVEKSNKIEELYKEIAKQRDEKSELHKQVSILSSENASLKTSLQYLRCEKPGCPHRTPPTGF